jgi:hypothetical protein
LAYCPKCKAEFDDEVSVCPECGDLIADQRPVASGAAMATDFYWTQICGVRSESRAENAKEALDSNNIPSVIMSSKFMSRNRHQLVTSFPGLEATDISIVMVPKEFREEAEIVVEAALGDDWIPLDAR